MTARMPAAALVVAYLAAIVAANLSISHWGPNAAIYNAFLFIGLDLTCRDRLHDLWQGRLLRNMALLIVAGSVLSYLAGLWIGTGPFVGRIALASCIAFGCAATADGITYHLLRHRDWYERVNQSNVAGAAVDSIVFVALWPFGFQFTLAFTLFAAKVAGGVVWSFVLRSSPGADWMRRNRLLWGHQVTRVLSGVPKDNTG